MKQLAAFLLCIGLCAGFVQAQLCLSPPNSLSAVLDTTTYQLSLSWAGADSALKCEIQVKVAGDSTFRRVIVNSNSGFNVNGARNLDPATTYEWRVRCACSLPPDPLVVSPFSAVASFSTPPALRVAQGASTVGIELYPNPASEQLHVRYGAEQDARIRLSVLDLSGRIVMESEQQTFSGPNTLSIALDALQPGHYLLQIDGDSQRLHAPFQVMTR